MNYSRAFSYVFEDKNWFTKILIAGLISLIPIVGQIYLFGWTVEIVRRVKAGRVDVLPATHFSYFLTLGLKMFVVSLIYSIPVIILSGIGNLLGASAANQDQGFFTAILTGLGCLGGLLSLVVNIAVALLGTYGMIKLAETDQIKACLDFSDAFNCIKSNLKGFIIVELLAIVAGLIGAAGGIICIGIILTVPYASAITGHLVGQLWDNLQPYDKNARPVRGSAVKTENDIIEEAPFTKVEDIEKDAASDIRESVEAVEESAETAAEAAEDIITEAPSAAAETVIETAEEIIIEEPVSEEPAPEAPAEEEEKKDDDLPSFE